MSSGRGWTLGEFVTALEQTFLDTPIAQPFPFHLTVLSIVRPFPLLHADTPSHPYLVFLQDLQASTSADKSSSSSSAPPPLPKKKNRIVGDSRGGPSPDIDDKLTNVEGSREMELRQGVEGLEVGEEAAGSKMGGVESVGSSSSTGEKEDEDVALPPSTSSNSTSVDPPADDEDGEEMRASTPTPMESGLVPSTDPDDITSISKAASMDDSKTTISTTATVDSNEDISISSVATPIATPVGEQPPILPTAEGVESSDMMDADGILGAAGAAVVGGGEKGLKRKHVVGSDSSLLGRSESYSMETKKAKEDEVCSHLSLSTLSEGGIWRGELD